MGDAMKVTAALAIIGLAIMAGLFAALARWGDCALAEFDDGDRSDPRARRACHHRVPMRGAPG